MQYRDGVANEATIARDLSAGLTVAMVGLPQCLAYALLSGLPPAYGLSTAGVAGLVAALAGRSPRVVTGPTNTTGLLIFGALTPYLGPSGLLEPEGLPYLATLTLLSGALRLGLVVTGGERLLSFLPTSVLAGFLAGAGLLIGLMQLDEALGLPSPAVGGLPGEIRAVAVSLTEEGVHPLPLALTVFTAGILVLGRRSKWPIALVVVMIGAAFAYVLEGSAWSIPMIRDRAPIPVGYPQGAWPIMNPQVLWHLSMPALAIVLLGTLELTVSARTEGARPNMRREISAQGLANLVGAFASCFPASASLTRSALLRLGGAQTRVAAATAALATLPFLYFGHELVGHIPQASLAGILWAVAFRMLNRGRMLTIARTSRVGAFLLATTFIATLALPLEQAILLGTLLGVVFHLSSTAQPRLQWLMLNEHSELVSATLHATQVVAEVSGALYYAAVPDLFQRLETERPSRCKVVFLDLSHAHQVRFAALEELEGYAGRMKRQNVEVQLVGIRPEVKAMLEQVGSKLRREPFDPTPGRSARSALQKRSRSTHSPPSSG